MREATNDHRLLTQIQCDNLLSFGPGTPPLPMETLNVLVGPNGSGKSNLIEAIALMRATADDYQSVLRQGGGCDEWVWKGNRGIPASVNLMIVNAIRRRRMHHAIKFRADGQSKAELVYERIDAPTRPASEPFYDLRSGNPVVRTSRRRDQQLDRETFNRDLSVLAQLRDPQSFPEITFLADAYRQIRIYREWAFGRNSIFRQPQRADMRNDRLEEDFSNLGLFVNRLRRDPAAKSDVLDGLRDLYEGLTDFDVIVEGGTVQVFFTEGRFTIPATRLSDGTLRFLCLLAILHDPKPPPLICIEEPELGLHPDLLPKLADNLISASERTQLIVTTHSDILVDALTDRPETVVVCEKHGGRTEMQRLSRDDLAGWLDKYRLGQLWTKGHIGGTRW